MDERDEVIEIDLREILDIVLSNLKTVGKVTLGFIVLAVLYLLIAKPVYESETTVRVQREQGLGDSLLESAAFGSSQASQLRMATYSEILKSRSVVIPVIEATEQANDAGKYPGYDAYVKNRIVTTPRANTEILSIKVNANTPEGAQQANKLLVHGFLGKLTEMSQLGSSATRSFLDKRVAQARDELTKAEKALSDYKMQHQIITPSDNAKAFMSRLALIDKESAANRLTMEQAQATLDMANSQLAGAGRSTADSATIKQYNAQLAKLEALRIEYKEKYTEKHPKLQEINQQISELQAKIDAEVERVANLEAPSDNRVHQELIAGKFKGEGQVAAAQAKQAELDRLIRENEEALSKLPETEQGYVRLSRDAELANTIYKMLAQRLEESRIAESMVANDVQIVDMATLPEKPIRPRKALTLAVAALFGLLLSSGWVIMGELMNRRIRTEDDITRFLELTVLGAVPDEISLNRAMDEAKKYGDKTHKPSLKTRIRRALWHK